jgi:hypothetical protein
MKFSKTNSKLFKGKYFTFIFIFIFTASVGMLLYQKYVRSSPTSIIEGLNLDTSNPKISNLLSKFSNFFQDKCLTGCVRLDNVNKTKCEQKTDENNNKIYECPWVCDTKKFEKDLQSKPQLKQQLSASQRCSPETEQRDCGSCVPNRVFSV